MTFRQSPLTELEAPIRSLGVGGAVSFWIQERPFRTHINLRGDTSEARFVEAVATATGVVLPQDPNTCVSSDRWHVSWLSPDEWLLIGHEDDAAVAVLVDQLESLHHALNEISGGQTVFRVGGDAWRDVLASACPFDLHPRAFGEGACGQTVVAHTNVVLIFVNDDPRGEALDIVVRRSFADHLARWLMDAAIEGGFEMLAPARVS
ncbi:MAG: sarcosine oxidase subunit gamma [Arenicellales bacterium]|tara:strand:+ start:38 stop:655 length:618 start_codon:yes stop_codon:yes gene_type:complete